MLKKTIEPGTDDSGSGGSSGPARNVATWLAVFGVSTLFLLINSATVWYGYRAGFFPNAQPMRWGTLLLEQLTVWYPVALLAPACLWLAARFQLGRERWLPTLAIHLGINLAFHVCLILISLPLSQLIWREPIFSLRFLQNLHQRLIGRLPVDVIFYWTIVGAGYAFEYYRRFREQQLQAARLELRATQLETQLAQAQLQALKMQLHPHFLFNTLHAISALIDDDVKVTRRMIARLSELLRLTLENVGQQEVSLRQELDALERYLEIEQIRFQDRLTVRFAVAPETLDASVPNLVLQPIVENAIRHGIAPRSSAGRIEIRAERRDGRIELQVIDDGPGLQRCDEEGAEEFKEGIGLANTRARLRRLYGDEHQIEIKDADEGGLAVRLSIPFRQAEVDGAGRE
ncbi:MAG TPA: histidine kinase [Blastocatellia bacterium]|jgi:sensor histidine kinase YesM|nr:histidine kinase [Blastocatellia bacterium]